MAEGSETISPNRIEEIMNRFLENFEQALQNPTVEGLIDTFRDFQDELRPFSVRVNSRDEMAIFMTSFFNDDEVGDYATRIWNHEYAHQLAAQIMNIYGSIRIVAHDGALRCAIFEQDLDLVKLASAGDVSRFLRIQAFINFAPTMFGLEYYEEENGGYLMLQVANELDPSHAVSAQDLEQILYQEEELADGLRELHRVIFPEEYDTV